MADLGLSFAMTPYDRVLPLMTGEVKPRGIALEVDSVTRPMPTPRLFYEQMKFQRFDVAEMSFSSFLIERAKGWPYRMLPVFHNRNFRYANIVTHAESGIRQDHPEDLKGKRFAIADYQMSLGLWMRGVLQHEFSVLPADLSWLQLRGEHYSHTAASQTSLPAGVKLAFANADEGTLFAHGEVDASISYAGPGVTTLFSDLMAEVARFFRKHRIYPPHHITVVREAVLDRHPWVALSLMDAFEEAKRLAIQRLGHQSLFVFGQRYLREERELLGPDPFAYGVKSNSAAIDMVQNFSVEQGLTTAKASWTDLFPEEVLLADEAAVQL